ncbi:PIN domain-containing protein [Treponema primitia]|uniref:PIN domain-containing protein n=1 Tax=Treponema primitia TaxID=88058 RepID=UPI0009DA5110|nr:PIN domain-containing protein [Treponema primitia]
MASSLDTNCLLRWLLGDEPMQTAAITNLLDSGQTFVAEDAAIIETIFVLEKVKKISRQAINKAVLTIIAQGNIKCSREIFNETMAIYENHPKLSAVDCYLAVLARLNNTIPLFTFDEKLAKQISETKLVV